MKKYTLIFTALLFCFVIYGQEPDSNKPIEDKIMPLNALTGSYDKQNNFEKLHKNQSDFKLKNPINDCSSDFWTINNIGIIQQWSLINNSITGGDTIQVGGGAGLAFCGNESSPTFYCGNSPNTGIIYYDSLNNWVNIPISVILSNNGGYENHQYYMATTLDPLLGYEVNRILYYFNGLNLTIIDSLNSDYFSVFDVAVDTLGQAWVFKGNSVTSVTKLNVYNNTGLITSYNITFNSSGTYGSFFLNDTLYVGMAGNSTNPNSVTPIIITGSVAQLGNPIPFTYSSYYDMASCQNNETLTTTISELSNSDINIFPNPTNGIIYLSTPVNTINIEIYNLNGQMITKLKQKSKIDLAELTDGFYFVKIITQNREYYKKIIKQ